MATRAQARSRTEVILDNPLDGEDLLRDALFSSNRAPQPVAPPVAPAPRPQHYKIISISLYNEDIERLDRMVRELKRRGHYKANKSQLIRFALAQLNLDKVPNAARAPALFDDGQEPAPQRR
jgi:hypothetical protein